MTVSVAAALLAALALATLPSGSAQVLDPAVSVTLGASQVSLGPGNVTELEGTVTNDNAQVASTVTLAFTAPAGWLVELDPASAFDLAAGASQTFTLVVTAPADATPADGALSVTATANDATGRSGTSAPATVALSFVPPPPPPPVPWYRTPGGIAGIALGILAVAGIVAGVAWDRRKKRLAAEAAAAEAAAKAAYMDRETGIAVSLASDPIQYGHRREVVYRVAVKNESPRPRVAIVDVAEVTNGWRAATQVAKLPLSVGETQHVTLVVTPDAVITPGDRARVVVRAKPEEARELDQRVTIDVVAPKHGVPQDPNWKIVSVQREGAGSPATQRR